LIEGCFYVSKGGENERQDVEKYFYVDQFLSEGTVDKHQKTSGPKV
jgi:hypothetical protein